MERDTHILSFALMWYGQKRAKTYALPDYSIYKKDKHNDSFLLRDLWDTLDQADIVIAHNGQAFDIKKINARLAVHGFEPPSPYKVIDTLKLARKTFKFDSAKLDNLGRYLGVGRKLPNTGAHLWRGCVNGDLRAWETMRHYNAQDVVLLEKVYQKLKAWGGVPDLRPYNGSRGCPTCLSPRVIRQGFRVARTRRYARMQCQDCGHWFMGNKC